MKRAGLITAAALLLLLTGCTSTPAPEPAQTDQAAVTADAPETTAPLVAETPAAQQSANTPETQFLAEFRAGQHANTQIPNATDEQLLAAGQKACEQIAAGTPVEQITVIDGETPDQLGYYGDSQLIAVIASSTICG